MTAENPMWTCPECGRRFANRGQVHTCGELTDLDSHFVNSDENVRATFDEFVEAVRALGPIEIVPQATRIALQARMSFAALVPRRHWLDGHLVLAVPVNDPRFRKTVTYSKQNHVHEFRLVNPEDVDQGMRRWIADAYDVGVQKHHGRTSR